MKRRQFLKVGALTLSAPFIGCESFKAPPSEEEIEKGNRKLEPRILEDFLKGDICVNKKTIESSLYDIYEEREGTLGRAVCIGGNFLLTLYDLVKENPESLIVIHQSFRGSSIGKFGFEIVHYNEKSNLALLRSHERRGDKKGKLQKFPHQIETDKAKLHLSLSSPPPLEDKLSPLTLSTFILLSGKAPKERYEEEFFGEDYYPTRSDRSVTLPKCGKFILPACSLLFEKQGKLLKLDEEFFYSHFRKRKSSKAECFTTLVCYEPERGQPVFLIAGEDKYIFLGVINEVVGAKHHKNMIDTPNNPLGYKNMQQKYSFVIHRDPIEKLVREYTQSLAK